MKIYYKSKSNSFPCQPSLAQPSQPSQPSLSRHPASPALLPAVRLPHGGEWFLKVLLGVFARVSGRIRICSYQSDFGIDLFFVWRNKAFLAPRCVWCGKTRVINISGAFGVAK